MVISGIVTETGGLVSHASCLAREYGLPAVQLENAMRRIPDGATIALDANTARIVVVYQEPVPAPSSYRRYSSPAHVTQTRPDS